MAARSGEIGEGVIPTVHEATATWRGDLSGGKGNVTTKSGVLKQAAASWKERTEGTGAEGATSPEELLAAAQAASRWRSPRGS